MFLSKEKEKQDPQDIKAYEEGYNLYQRGCYQEALPIFKDLLYAYPFSKDIWQTYAATQQMLKCYEEAVKAWAMVAIIDIHDPYPHLHAAECFLCLSDYEQMLKTFEQIKAMPNALNDRYLKERIEKLLS